MLAALQIVSAVVLTSCDKGSSDPEDVPVITSINPPAAGPGDQVTILGDNFGLEPQEVAVKFGDLPAEVTFATNKRIVTIVPDVEPGSSPVVVTVGDLSSAPFSFDVLRKPPRITALTPALLRAGETLGIRGEDLQGATVSVLADTVALAPASVADTLVTVILPLGLAPGTYQIRLARDDETSNRVPVDVEIFTVTGTYSLRGTVLLNSCPEGPAVGSQVNRTATITDQRPAITAEVSGLGIMRGVLNTSGSFTTTLEGSSTTFSGDFEATPESVAGFTGRLTIRPRSTCRTVEEVSATRTAAGG